MATLTITNNDLGSVMYAGDASFDDDVLTLSGAQTVAEGTILARNTNTNKLVFFVPGGEASKTGGSQNYVLDAGDTMVINTNGGGAETVTFDAAAGSQTDSTTYTGGTAATITDTTTYAVADQDTKTSIVTQTDAVNGTTVTTVTFSGTTTTALQVAAGFAAQLPHCSANVVGGQVKLTTDEVGADCSISVAAGTGDLTWAAPVAGTGGLADQDGLNMTVTVDGGTAQTVTFSGLTTENTQIASQINAQVVGASAAVVGGQVKVTSDSQGTGSSIAMGAGTSGLSFAAAVAGTGDVANIKAVTAAEVKTVTEADTTDLTVTVSGGTIVFTATTSIAFVSGDALTPLGLSVETVYAYGNGTPIKVLVNELAGANGDNQVRPLMGGKVIEERLAINNGSSVTQAIKDQLQDVGIIVQPATELNDLDNQ